MHLCARRPGDSPAAVARVVVLALLYAFDRSTGWSDDSSWRRLNGWRPSIASGLRPRPANVSPAGFASPRGQLSPRWDLVTFMAASWLDDSLPDIGCRLLSHGRYVERRLDALGPRASGAPPAARARCPAFEEWAALEHLADVEVVLAAPSTAMIGSLFGHVFLRLVYRDENGEMPPHLSRTVAFLADNDAPFRRTAPMRSRGSPATTRPRSTSVRFWTPTASTWSSKAATSGAGGSTSTRENDGRCWNGSGPSSMVAVTRTISFGATARP